MFDAIPVPPPLIIVEEASSHQPTIFLGFLAVGSEANMVKLQERATSLRLPVTRSVNDKEEDGVMVMFPPGSDHLAGLQTYRDALSGRFGKLKLEVMIITKEKAQDGIDLGTDASAEPPSAIVIPAN